MRPSQSSAEGHRSTAGNAVEPICLENLLALDTWFRAQIFPTEGAESGSPSHRCRPRAEGTTLRARRGCRGRGSRGRRLFWLISRRNDSYRPISCSISEMDRGQCLSGEMDITGCEFPIDPEVGVRDRKSTRLNSSHVAI